MIKANDAVFAATPPNAPKQLLEACDFLESFLPVAGANKPN